MTLTRQLLLLALLLLALPLAGWQVAVQVESYLRSAREDALLATVKSLARAWELEGAEGLAEAGEGLYVHRVVHPMVTDGYVDDWTALLEGGREYSSPDQRLRMRLILARDERRLYALIQVHDRSAQRARLAPAGFEPGDHLLLALEDRRGLQQLRLMPSVPGTLDVMPASGAERARDLPVSGAWRELPDGRGYRVEISLPLGLARERLGLVAVDSDEPWVGSGPARAGTLRDDAVMVLRALSERDPAWSEKLADLGPPDDRLWLVDRHGRVMGTAGGLQPDSSRERHWWRSLVYRMLARSVLSEPQARDASMQLSLSGEEIRDALRGRPRVRWSPSANQFTVLASAAAPVRHGDQVVGAVVLEQASDGLLLATNRTVARTVTGTLVVVLVLVLGLMVFAGVHSWRIRRLRDAMEAALDREVQGVDRLPASGAGDEIGDLSRSFAVLLEELGEYNDYLRSLAAKLSHELNTPLAVVRSSLDNLSQLALPEDARPYAERARQGADRLQAILRAMSEAHRLEESLEGLEGERFDLAQVAGACVEAYASVAPEFDWRFEAPKGPCELTGSPEAIAQLLDKLTDNARSFTPEGGRIRVRVGCDRRGLLLVVANDGPPLPDMLKGRLFESLVSVRDEADHGSHLGLGLHLVRLIARAHGGAVAARNRTGPNGAHAGVEFSVRLRGLRQAA